MLKHVTGIKLMYIRVTEIRFLWEICKHTHIMAKIWFCCPWKAQSFVRYYCCSFCLHTGYCDMMLGIIVMFYYTEMRYWILCLNNATLLLRYRCRYHVRRTRWSNKQFWGQKYSLTHAHTTPFAASTSLVVSFVRSFLRSFVRSFVIQI